MDGARDALLLAAAGAAAVCAFDIIRALRRGANAPKMISAVLDFLSIAAAAAALWGALLLFAHGEMRLCEVLCIISGAVVYIFTVRDIVFRLFCVIFKNIFKFLHFILKILLTPARFLYKIVVVGKSHKYTENGDDTDVQKDRQVSRRNAGEQKKQ